MSISFEHLKGEEFNGVRELADAAERVLRATGQSQERSTVAEYPNERTIRYYITEGLLSPSIEKRGATSVFNHQHLLSLLVIKKLQAEGLPINIIRQIISGRSEDALMALLGNEVDGHAVDDLCQASPGADAQAISDLSSEKPERNAAREYLEQLLFSRSSSDQSASAIYMPAPAAAAPNPTILKSAAQANQTNAWRREEVAPGLEVHIRDDYKPPAGYRETTKLLAKFKQILRL